MLKLLPKCRFRTSKSACERTEEAVLYEALQENTEECYLVFLFLLWAAPSSFMSLFPELSDSQHELTLWLKKPEADFSFYCILHAFIVKNQMEKRLQSLL